MTLYTRARTRESYLEEIEAPLLSALGVSAQEALLYSPVSSIGRFVELSNEMYGEPVGIGGFDEGFGERRATSPMVSAADARKRIADEGLDLAVPDAGIRQGALDVLIARKKDERRRQDILSRAPGGFFPTAAMFGVGVAASLLDPINVGVSFLPVIGPARYAMMLERAGSTIGRMGVRAGVGALEGAAGAALVEPIVLAAATQEQADYGLVDTLFNIALGTALGGGLHVGAGAIGDALSRGRPWQTARATEPLPRVLEGVEPSTREALLRTSVAQAVSGRVVDVEPVIRADPGFVNDWDPNVLFAEPRMPPAAPDFDLGPVTGSRYADYTQLSPGDLRMLDNVVRELEGTSGGTRWFIETDRQGGTPIVGGQKGDTPAWFTRYNQEAKRSQAERKRAIQRNRRAGAEIAPVPDALPILTQDRVRKVADKIARREPLGVAEARVAEEIVGIAREYRERNVRDMLGARYARQQEAEASIDAIAEREARAIADAERIAGPEGSRLADFDASRQGDEIAARVKTPDEQLIEESLSDVLDDLGRMTDAMGDDAILARELAPFDELVEFADTAERAIRAAAECRLRRG